MSNMNEVVITVYNGREMICEECNKQFESKVALTVHLSKTHKIGYDDYLVKHYNNGVRPHCAVCKNETRFISKNRSFKKYCIEHANQSRADWSKQNGYGANQDAGWKRGLTKENNDVIKKHSEWMTGENNPMHKNNPRNRNENDD